MVDTPASDAASNPNTSQTPVSAGTFGIVPSVWVLTIASIAILALSVGLRVGDLDAMVNVDMHLVWVRRITRFIEGVSTGQFQETYQTHHPGVTFMWSAGLLWKAFGLLGTPLDPEKLKITVWPVLVVGSLFPVASFWLMLRCLGRERLVEALLVAILFAAEPMLVAHSRNAHLDVLVTSFAWVAVLAALIAKRDASYRWAVISGALLGLALLSKISAAGYAMGIALVFAYTCARQNPFPTRLFKVLVVIAATSAVVVVLLWPAMWVAPQMVVERLYKGLNSEVDKVGEFMFLGHTGRVSPPFWSYGIFVIYLVTPEFFIPGAFLVATGRWLEPRIKRFTIDACLVTVPLVFFIAKSNHVGTRYLIPALPILGTLSSVALAQGYRALRSRLSNSRVHAVFVALAVVLVVGRSVRIANLYPLPITYCSRWTGVECGRLFHTGWGEGMKEAALFINDHAKQRWNGQELTVFGGGCASTMTVWSPARFTKDIQAAQLLIQYLPDRQRNVPSSRAIEEFIATHQLAPLHEVVLDGRTYVWIYPGPHY
jgi:hypothetical protein